MEKSQELEIPLSPLLSVVTLTEGEPLSQKMVRVVDHGGQSTFIRGGRFESSCQSGKDNVTVRAE